MPRPVHFVLSRPTTGVCPPGSETAFVVLDDAQLLARTPVLQALLQAREATGAAVSVVAVSAVEWGCREASGMPMMPMVHFANYSEDDVPEVLAKVGAQTFTNSGESGSS